MAANEACPTGNEIRNSARCLEAEQWASVLGLEPKRALVQNDWVALPFQCSAQIQNDDTFHFNTNANSDNTRFVTGEFVMICEKGA